MAFIYLGSRSVACCFVRRELALSYVSSLYKPAVGPCEGCLRELFPSYPWKLKKENNETTTDASAAPCAAVFRCLLVSLSVVVAVVFVLHHGL